MYDYHLIIPKVFYRILIPIASNLNMTVNVLIRSFINLTIDNIDLLFQDYGKQPKPIYEKLGDSSHHIHIWMNYKVYQRLKQIHGHYNNFSVAQIVRKCIFFMLKMIDEYGTLEAAIKELQKLENATRKFHKTKNKQGFIKNLPKIRHLLGDIHVSYEVIALFIESLIDWLDSPPLLEK